MGEFKHTVKDGRDVILDGKVYHAGADGTVILPRKIETKHIKPVQDDEEGDLDGMTVKELYAYAKEKEIEIPGDIRKKEDLLEYIKMAIEEREEQA